MKNYSELIEAVIENGYEVDWFGGASEDEIAKLEELLGIKMPPSYRDFLLQYGGGGIIESEFSGIEDNDVSLQYGGTTYSDTMYCRKDFGLPEHLIVIYLRDDEVCWCLDSSQVVDENQEYPVVSYDVFSRRVVKNIADNFEEFFKEFFELRAQKED